MIREGWGVRQGVFVVPLFIMPPLAVVAIVVPPVALLPLAVVVPPVAVLPLADATPPNG